MTVTQQNAGAAAERGRPMVCAVCGRVARLEGHTVSADIDDVAACAEYEAGAGEVVWLCAEVCHPTVHRIMAETNGQERALQAVVTMLRRLAAIVDGPQRTYRKQEGSSGDDG